MESTVPASEKFVPEAPPGETPTGFLAQIRASLDVAPKTMAGLLSISLLVGGLLFLIYFWSVGFMPEMDVQASLTILIAAAITGAFVLFYIVLFLLLPGLSLCFSLQGERSPVKRTLWFALPLFSVFLLCGINCGNFYSVATVALLAFLLYLFITKSWSKAVAYLLGVFFGYRFIFFNLCDCRSRFT